jgi:hypothetical protein
VAAVSNALDDLLEWLAANGPAGSDPYDALNSPFARLAAALGRWGRIAFLQTARRSPIALRRFLLVPPSINPKAMGLLVHAYLDLFESRGEEKYLDLARDCLAWLEQHAARCDGRIGWGYPFDWPARAFFVPKGTPSVVVSSVVGEAFLRAAKTFEDTHYLDVARATAAFMLTDLHRTESEQGLCFSYTPLDHSRIFNASLLGACLLARLGIDRGGDQLLLEPARRATRFVLQNQNPDGSWCYGLAPFHRWIDGHHTGFLLRGLARISTATGWEEVVSPLERGLAFYLENLITADGRPNFRLGKPWPADIHACAEAILVLADPSLGQRVSGLEDRALHVAEWTLGNLRRDDGAFGYLKYPHRVDWTPHLRWGQAWMLCALARLEKRLSGRCDHSNSSRGSIGS